MRKRMIVMLISMGILFGLVFFIKLVTGLIGRYFITINQSQIVTVSAMPAKYELWESKYNAAGSLRAIKGVNVTTELAGMVDTIYFTPGAVVKKDELLVQLNIKPDVAQLEALEASEALAEINYKRDQAQYLIQGVSKAVVDADLANLKSYKAQVEEQKANIDKKTIRAPFTGHLGISAVNPGQYINPGDKIVTLQQLDPIYADFYLPQQALAVLKVGMPVTLTVDTYGNQLFKGKVTTIDPLVDVNTRNVQIEATVDNPKSKLIPGMFSNVIVNTEQATKYLTVPETAISYNSFGNVVFIVNNKGKDRKGKPILTVTQSFVTTGETRGDQIAILKGIKAGQMVVTSGQLKLKNGSYITINNKVEPPNNPNPNLTDQ